MVQCNEGSLLHSLECDHRKQMEAKGAQMGGGGSLVNKLVQAGLCFTKVNHEILAEAGQKCYCELLEVYVRLSCRSFQNRWISLHFPMGPPLHLIHRCVSVFLARHGKTVYDKVRQCPDAFPWDPLFTGGVCLGPTWVPIMSQVFVH